MCNLILDHVVHDHTTCHHLPQGPWIPLFSRSTNNCKTDLQNSRCPLDILFRCFLSLSKVSLFLANWIRDGANKGSPQRIDTVNQLVSHVVLMFIDSIVARRSFSFSQPRKQRRSLQHIDVIVRPRHARKVCQIQKSCDATASRMMVGFLT